MSPADMTLAALAEKMDRPLGYLTCSLMALMGGPYVRISVKGFRGPTLQTLSPEKVCKTSGENKRTRARVAKMQLTVLLKNC